jgi:sugar phosphate permease
MTPKRRVLLLIWLMMAVAYLDRTNITMAGPTVMAALHLSKTQFGFVLAAFTFGYALMQIPGGGLADRVGSRPLLITALLVWSVFTALTGLATSLVSLIAVRVLFGVGEGIENGAQFKLIGDYFPSRERSSANAFFLTALALGPAAAAPAATWLLGWVGWHALFFWFSLPGLVVAVLLYAFLPRRLGEVVHTEVAGEAGRAFGWGDALGRRASWLAFAAYLFFNVAFWGFLGWMPSYLSQSRHIELKALGPLSSVPYLCGFVGIVLLGWLGAGALFRYRAAMIAVSYLLAGVFLCVAFTAATVPRCIVGLSLAAFFLYGGFGPFWAIALDLIPDGMRGAFTGFVNLGGQIGGFCAPIAVGALIAHTHSFTDGFLLMAAALVLSAGSLLWLQASGGPPPIDDRPRATATDGGQPRGVAPTHDGQWRGA